MESVHFVPDQCANFASHFSSIKIFQIDLFYFASHFIRVQIFQICFSLKSEKFLFPPPHYNFGIVHWMEIYTSYIQKMWQSSISFWTEFTLFDFVIHILISSVQNWFFYQNYAISSMFREVPLWCYSSRLMKYWGILLYQKVWSKKPIRMFPVSWGEIKRSPPSLLGFNFSSWL